jgi:HTH-type transcriptional regulator/antitoxin HigA
MEGLVDMHTIEFTKALDTWPQMAEMIYVPHGEEEYERLVNFLDNLIDEVGEDESHPLSSLMEIVGILIERYEDEHVPELTENRFSATVNA